MFWVAVTFSSVLDVIVVMAEIHGQQPAAEALTASITAFIWSMLVPSVHLAMS